MNGATPVPGPINIRGHLWLAGSKNSRVSRRNTGTSIVASFEARRGSQSFSIHLVQSPDRWIPPDVVYWTTVKATTMDDFFFSGEDAME